MAGKLQQNGDANDELVKKLRQEIADKDDDIQDLK